jgi:soluble lytic murein transglycosylase-like protein
MRLKITTISLFLLFSTPLLALSNKGGAVTAAPGSAVTFAQAFKLRAVTSSETAIPLLRACAADQAFSLRDYAQFEIARTYFNDGNYQSAVTEFDLFIKNYPDSLLLPQAKLTLGKSFFKLKNYPRAIKTFRELAENAPESEAAPAASYLIARVYELQKKWPEAYLSYEDTDLNYPLSFFGRLSRLASAELKRKHKKKLPKFKATAKALYKQGMTYFDENDYETASNIFNRLAREFPKSKYIGEAWLMLGRAEMQTGSPAAIPDLERAAGGSPNLAGRAIYYLGLTYGRRGNYERAVAALEKMAARFPDSELADDAIYWSAYYKELSGDVNGALRSYYDVVNKYPSSSSAPAAIWRIGKTYYWNSDFKNAATYLHIAQLYPPGEDTPRCSFFEAKAQEHLGNQAAALDLYGQLAKRFDHSYYAYRAKEKLKSKGRALNEPATFDKEEFSQALNNLDEKDQAGLAAVMEIWEQTKVSPEEMGSSREVQAHLAKYKELMSLGVTEYAADEAKYLVNLTSDVEKDSAQTRLGEMLIRSGEYKTPIKFADRKVKDAITLGKPEALPKKVWQLAYPKGYWSSVAPKAEAFGLDPYLVLAVIREESRFNPKAVSHSGARGLMQIMPRTGRAIARDLDKTGFRTRKLFAPALNIEMGAYYLSNLIKNFQGNVYLSLAGYNGGPNKIKRYIKSWYNDNLGSVDIDEFIESLPSRETRLYVQKVMGSYFEYKRLYDRKNG